MLKAGEGPAWAVGPHGPGEGICATPLWCEHHGWVAMDGPTAGGESDKCSLVSTGSLEKVFSFTRNCFMQFPSGVLCLPGHGGRPTPLPHQCFSLYIIISPVAPETISTVQRVEPAGRGKLVRTDCRNGGGEMSWTRGCCDLLWLCCSRTSAKPFPFSVSFLSHLSSGLVRQWMT